MGNDLSRQRTSERLYERPRLEVLQECVAAQIPVLVASAFAPLATPPS